MNELLTAKLICDYLEDMYYFFIEKEEVRYHPDDK
jgi:hypothetical protein